MRIGFAIPALDGGGAESVTRQWSAALSGAGHRVCAYTFDPRGSAGLDLPGSTHRHFPHRSTLSRWLALPLWLRRQAKRDRLDVLVTMLTFTNLAGLAALRCGVRSPVALTIVEHNVPTLELLIGGGGGARTKRRLARRLYRRADAAIGVSHSVVADLIGGYGVDPGRAFAVPNPIVSRPRPEPAPPPRRLNVAFVGRLVDQKRPLLFVDALAALAERGIEVRGTVLGEGELREEVEARAAARGVPLELRGWRQPWWEAAADVDCVLLPSSFEGLANVLVEAAAARIPAVACSEALGTADAVVPGLTGELVLGSEPGRLADGVIRALGSRGADPLEAWLSRFSVETSAELLLEVLDRASSARRA